MASPPPPSTYHHLVGSHARATNRLVAGAVLGVLAGLIASRFVPWQLAVLAGWDVVAAVILAVGWHIMVPADAARTAYLATIQDETRGTARILVVVASTLSLAGVAVLLNRAATESFETAKVGLIAAALLTVVLSWTLVNTVFTLHYAHLYYEADGGAIDFGPEGAPDYRDFAYVAFTIGMTYQVSDTALRSRAIRRTALRHGLLAYVFGVVIVATTINIIAGLV